MRFSHFSDFDEPERRAGIDEAGRDVQAGAVDDLGVGGDFDFALRADGRDLLTVDEERAVENLGAVDRIERGTDDCDAAASGCGDVERARPHVGGGERERRREYRPGDHRVGQSARRRSVLPWKFRGR